MGLLEQVNENSPITRMSEDNTASLEMNDLELAFGFRHCSPIPAKKTTTGIKNEDLTFSPRRVGVKEFFFKKQFVFRQKYKLN